VLMEGVSSLVVGVCLLGTLFPLCFPHFTMAKYWKYAKKQKTTFDNIPNYNHLQTKIESRN